MLDVIELMENLVGSKVAKISPNHRLLLGDQEYPVKRVQDEIANDDATGWY